MELLDESKHDLDAFFEMALDHLVVAGFDGYFKRLSRAWTQTLGWTQEEFLARPVIEFVHPDDRAGVLAGRQGLIDGVPLIGLVNRYRHKDGSYRWFEWRSVGYPERKLVYAVAREITLQKQLEQEREDARAQLVVAERMASLGRLAGGVAHEINNPLAYVMSNLRMALEEVRGPSELDGAVRAELGDMLADALSGAERVSGVVAGLQMLAGSGNEVRGPVAVREPLQLALSLLDGDLRRRARLVEVYRDAPMVLADRGRLGQVLVNLLLNAADAIPPGQPSQHEIRVRTATDPLGRALIEIEDTGAGISSELRAQIFEPFFTTRPARASGLGLSICRSIVNALGGEISVASAPGMGSTFRIALPPAPDAG